MKGKICFIVLSVVLAVSLGYTSDISAYTYRVKAQMAIMNENETKIVTSNTNTDRSQILDKDLLVDASETVDELIAEAIAAAEPVVTLNNDQVEAAEGTHDYSSSYEAEDYDYEEDETEYSETADQTEPQPEAEEEAEVSSEDSVLSAEESEAEDAWTVSTIDDSEIEVLRRIVMAEAGCEDMQGQIMVANVVLNRIAAGYGDTISEIVFAPGQFSPVANGTFCDVVPTESVIEAVNRALAGEDYSEGALFFVSPYGNTSWFFSDLTFVAEHGGHLFFK